MAQIIKHRRGSLEALSAVTASLQKGEIIIASGSSNLTTTNGTSIVFAVPESGSVQAVNRFLIGDNAPNTFAAGTYNGMVKGVPYYASGSSTLYLLGEGSNDIPNLVGNISVFSASVDSRLDSVEASLGGGGSIGTRVAALEVASASLNSFSSSQLDKDSNLATYTASVSTRLTEIGVVSGSLILSASADRVSITNLNTFSGSQLTQNSTLATYTGSLNTRLTEIGVVSGSLILSASAANVSITNLNSFSSSQLTQNSTLATYTGSINTRLTEIGVVTGSLIQSASNQLTRFENFTSSFSTAFGLSGANVTINGNLTVAGTTTAVNSTTIQLGDNIIELNGTGAANGGLIVKDPTAPNTVSGSLLWDSTNDYWKAGQVGAESKVLLAGSDSVVSGSSQINVYNTTNFSTFNSTLATITGSLISTASDHESRIDTIEASLGGGGSVGSRVAGLEALTGSYATTGSNTFVGNQTISASLNVSGSTNFNGAVAVNDSNMNLTNSSSLNLTSGSSIYVNGAGVISGSISGIGNVTAYSSSVSTQLTSIGTFTGSQLTQNSTLATYTGSVNTRLTEIGVVSGSLISSASAANVSITNLNSFSSSQLTQNTTLATYTGSVSTRLTEIGVVSGSLITSASAANVSITNLNTFSGSQLSKDSTLSTYTASVETRFSTLATTTGSLSNRITTLEGSGTIQGVGTTNNVTFGSLTTSNNVTVGGDLIVQGNTVTLNTTQLVIEDKLISLASGSANATAANGAGIEVIGANATFTYDSTPNAWTANIPISASAVTASVNVPGFGSSKRLAFRSTTGNLDFIAAPTTTGDIPQWDGTNFVMSNTIDGGTF